MKTENHIIKIISPQETHSVRHSILRAGRPIEDCVFDGDDLETTIHLGLFLSKKLIGVATFLENNTPLFKDQIQFQLRGMAILKEEQKKGFGELLLEEAERLLKNKNVNLIWFNAREIATSFYKKKGYKIIGDPFEIINIGTHYLMSKKII